MTRPRSAIVGLRVGLPVGILLWLIPGLPLAYWIWSLT
jgi:hypothetical protein